MASYFVTSTCWAHSFSNLFLVPLPIASRNNWNKISHYTYISEGNPLKVRAPSDPGTYEVRYILGHGNKLLARTSMEIKTVGFSVQAPASASAGAEFEVE